MPVSNIKKVRIHGPVKSLLGLIRPLAVLIQEIQLTPTMPIQRTLLLLISFTAAFCTGCAAPFVPLAPTEKVVEAKLYRPVEHRVAIYVYRKEQFEGSGIIYPVVVNGKIVGSLKSGTFLRVDIEPGTVEVASFTLVGQSAVKLTAAAGEVRYVASQYRVSAGTMFLGMPGSVEIREENSTLAHQEIAGLAMAATQ